MDDRHPDDKRATAIVESAPYLLLVIAADATISFVNPASRLLLGREPADIVGMSGFDLLAPASAEDAIQLFSEVQSRDPIDPLDPQATEVPLEFVRADGSRCTLLVSGHEAYTADAGGTVIRARPLDGGSLLDGYLHALHGEEPLAEIVRPLLQGLASDIPISAVTLASGWDASTNRFELTVDEVRSAPAVPDLGRRGPWVDALAGKAIIAATVDALPEEVGEQMRDLGLAACWCYPVNADDDGGTDTVLVVWRRSIGEPWVAEDRRVRQTVAFIQLARERRQREAQLAYAVSHDALTGVANRAHFFGELQRTDPGPMAVLYIDLDGYKTINDRLGHRAGDRVLTDVAQALQAAVDGSARIARIGGDEFGLICRGVDRDAVDRLAGQLVRAAATVVEVDGATFEVRASVGVAFGDGAADDAGERLLSLADEAMYTAKRRGGGRVAMVDDEP